MCPYKATKASPPPPLFVKYVPFLGNTEENDDDDDDERKYDDGNNNNPGCRGCLICLKQRHRERKRQRESEAVKTGNTI